MYSDVRNPYMRYLSFFGGGGGEGGRLGSAVDKDDVHRNATGINLLSKNVFDLTTTSIYMLWPICLGKHFYFEITVIGVCVYPQFLIICLNHVWFVHYNITKWGETGELSSESGASCLRASFSCGEVTLGRVVFGLVVLFPKGRADEGAKWYPVRVLLI